MAMHGIDISGWQKGINLDVVPYDFMISKATQGTNFVNSDCDRVVQQAFRAGKAVGIYHYIAGGNPIAEMDYFFNNCKNYLGKVVWCLDWESNQNSAWGNLGYLAQCIDRITQLTGKPPIVYCSAGSFPWDLCKQKNCGAWVAQYADNKATGYQDTPWNEGAYSCAIRQYSSSGRLNGYGANLDLNKFYGYRATWDKYIAGSNGGSTPAPAPQPAKKSNDEIANEVIAGAWGNGDDRKNRLAAAGYDYNAIQAIVNSKLAPAKKSVDEIAREVIAGAWGNGNDRRNRLQQAGYNFDEVQAKVNQLLGASASNVVQYTVQPGDTVSGIAARHGVGIGAISGFRSGNPNLIYPGEVLTIKK